MSVRETSCGNVDEDSTIESAIRESVRAMRARGATLDTLHEANNFFFEKGSIFEDEEYRIRYEDYQLLIEKAVQESLTSHTKDFYSPQISGSVREEFPAARQGNTTDTHNADLEGAIGESKTALPHSPVGYEADIQRTITKSKQELERELDEEEDEELKWALEESLKLQKAIDAGL
ncbi:hypothetical protein UVI_02002540 [Ustilaginoidea virens]|uniref:Uncharacterized protein n=1 Tax=Ustilaginoidea virens TaxID=1159556 RepID=A0A1B5L128_USTVR|nr:hypothetical protein UVI_02002540 [Ustilaginoidea virens]